MIKAIFLDKDGTLIENVPYNVDPDRMRLCWGTLTGVRKLYTAGYALIVITNQSGVARGYFSETAIAAVKERLQTLLEVPLTGFYYCPHHPEGTVAEYAISCICRKPEPGLLQQAVQEHDIDLSQSWLIGDILHDVEAGHRAGCRSILIDNGNETEWIMTPDRTPDYTTTNLSLAADFILQQQSYESPRRSNSTVA
ncbi:MAG: HAD-IIIA family hydrolase [Elainellaceae cyanobacterium]